MRDEVALVVVQSVVPVVEVFGEVDLFSCPEGGFCFLVHLPYLDRCKPSTFESTLRVPRVVNTNLVILDGEKHKAVRIFLKERLVCLLWFDRRCHSRCDFLLRIVKLDKGLLELKVVEKRGRDVRWKILLVDGLELQFLCRRVAHLEVL